MNDELTSESVSSGHPDKIADLISDTVLDAHLSQDPHARVACEVFVTTNFVLLGGEISSKADVHYDELVRKTVKELGYTKQEYGFCDQDLKILNCLKEQSPEIAKSVDKTEIGAGDQGIVFGFACNETPQFMPAGIHYSHQIMQSLENVRKEKKLPWLRPDAKTQLTLAYDENNQLKHIPVLVLSTQHDPHIELAELRQSLKEHIIHPLFDSTGLITPETHILINPSDSFILGGPASDAGLTGRKIIMDNYGGAAPVGGGAFSGKDPSKIDRTAAYMARFIAKHLVAAGLGSRALIQLAYVIGKSSPVSLRIELKDPRIPLEKVYQLVHEIFHLKVGQMIQELELLNPHYHQACNYGHFGKAHLPWEKLPHLEKINDYLRSHALI